MVHRSFKAPRLSILLTTAGAILLTQSSFAAISHPKDLESEYRKITFMSDKVAIPMLGPDSEWIGHSVVIKLKDATASDIKGELEEYPAAYNELCYVLKDSNGDLFKVKMADVREMWAHQSKNNP